MIIAPPAAEAALLRLSPLTRFGKPRFRLIHGSDALTWVEGWWEDLSSEGLFIRKVFEKRQCHKYLTKTDCWIMEIWEPPEFFGSPETWAAQTHEWEGGRGFSECGPYPSEGDYRYLTSFRHQGTGAPTMPTEAIIERIFSRLGVPTQGDLLEERTRKEEEEKKRRKEACAGVLDELPFGGKTDSINLNPRGLLDKLKEKREQTNVEH